jgi:hypothetical protein
MSDRFRSLLDDAAAEVRPRAVDPVAHVLRRAHEQRRRTITGVVSGLAAAAVLVGAAVAADRWMPDDRTDGQVADEVETAQPIVVEPPRVDDGVIRAGSLTLPIPDGWTTQVGPDTGVAYCKIRPDTVFVDTTVIPGASGQACDRQVLLPGGQPAWIPSFAKTPDELERNACCAKQGSMLLYVPWARVYLHVYGPKSDVLEIVASIRTTDVRPTRLVLPEDVRTARLVPLGSDLVEKRLYAEDADPDATALVTARLAGVDDVPAAEEEACPATGGEEQTGSITLRDAKGHTAGVVNITRRGDCAELVSSLGGRVRVPAPFVTDLEKLFPHQVER